MGHPDLPRRSAAEPGAIRPNYLRIRIPERYVPTRVRMGELTCWIDRKSKAVLALILASAVTLPSVAFAQNSSNTPATTRDSIAAQIKPALRTPSTIRDILRDPTFGLDRLDRDRMPITGRTNPLDMLDGKVSGLNVGRESGAPGEEVKVQLRDARLIQQALQPLVIIDGVYVSPLMFYSLRDIDAEDVASIEIIKGLAGAAEYGVRARGGVIRTSVACELGSSKSPLLRSVRANRLKLEVIGRNLFTVTGYEGRGLQGAAFGAPLDDFATPLVRTFTFSARFHF